MLAASLVAITLAAGCSGSEGGTPVTAGSGASQPASSSAAGPTSSSGQDTSVAPSVTDPLDTAELDQDPCVALTNAQVKNFGVEPGEKEKTGSDPTCTYRYGDDGGSLVSVTPMLSFSNGLSAVYSQRSDLGYFEPTEVSGYPGAYAGKFEDDRAKGYCNLYIAPNDQRAVWLNVQLGKSSRDYPKGCEVGEVVAEKMIENLKGGA